MKKKIYISISCVLVLLVIGGIVLAHINMLKKDFNKSDYKHIRIKNSWEKIYCDVNSHIVCAKTKDGYMEVYDADLKYLKKIKLPEYKKIKINGFEIIILKQDGTVWYCDTAKDNEFIIIDYLSNVDDIYPSFYYWIYKDKKGDFYYIQNYHYDDINQSNYEIVSKKPQLIKNLKGADILSFDTELVYTKDENTYVNFFYVSQKKLTLFDNDNNVTYDKCLEGITCTRAIEANSSIYLLDKNKIGYVYKNDINEIVVVEPVETNLEIKNVLEGKYRIYILDKNGKLYDDAYSFIIHEKDEPIFKYKKFNNIYDGNCLYATDNKYLYKLDKD